MKINSNRRDFLKVTTGLGAGLLLNSAACTTKTDCVSFFEVVNNRRSVRQFKATPIPSEHIDKMLNAARMAPTAGNQQPWKFVVIQQPETIKALKNECIKSASNYFRRQESATEEEINEMISKMEKSYNGYFSAPLYIVLLTDSNSKYPSYNDKDGPLAAANLLLAARAMGYGSVFLTDSVRSETVIKILNIPVNYKVVCTTPIGVPQEWPNTPPKKSLDELVVYEKF